MPLYLKIAIVVAALSMLASASAIVWAAIVIAKQKEGR